MFKSSAKTQSRQRRKKKTRGVLTVEVDGDDAQAHHVHHEKPGTGALVERHLPNHLAAHADQEHEPRGALEHEKSTVFAVFA